MNKVYIYYIIHLYYAYINLQIIVMIFIVFIPNVHRCLYMPLMEQ